MDKQRSYGPTMAVHIVFRELESHDSNINGVLTWFSAQNHAKSVYPTSWESPVPGAIYKIIPTESFWIWFSLTYSSSSVVIELLLYSLTWLENYLFNIFNQTSCQCENAAMFKCCNVQSSSWIGGVTSLGTWPENQLESHSTVQRLVGQCWQ